MDLYQPFIKTVSINDLPEGAWQYIVGGSQETQGLQEYYKSIPWLFRGVDIRSNAVASVPFAVMRGEDEIDTSDDWQNVVKFMPDPKALFAQIEAALVIWNYAYAFKKRNLFMTQGVRYMLPTSIKAKISETGDITFTRREGNKDVSYTVEDIIYFWKSDPFVEIGPPLASPAQAAANAAGVLFNADRLAEAFFKRGAIKATLLTTKNILPAERDRLKSWWKRMFGRGVDSAWQTDIVNADAVVPVVVGEGLESLENATLTESKRTDIAAALGIPYSVLFSNASNRATAEQDDKHFYDKTILPECEFIQEVLNKQLFVPMGYRLVFKSYEMDLYQTDENERAASLEKLIAALGSPEEFLLAADILGYELGDDIRKKIEEMVSKKAERAAEIQANMARIPENQPGNEQEPEKEPVPPQLQPPPPNNRSIDLGKWEQKALKRIKKGEKAACSFESDNIDPVTIASIGAHLEDAQNEQDVKAVFSDIWIGYP